MTEKSNYSPPLARLFNARLDSRTFKESSDFLPNYSHILQMHFKVFGTDGVSLEINNLSEYLGTQQKRVYFCSGDIPPSIGDQGIGKRVEGLNYQSKEIRTLTEKIFAKNIDTNDRVTLRANEEQLLAEILDRSLLIENEISKYIDRHNIGTLDIRNIFSLPYDLPAALGMYRLMEKRPELSFLLHHHDFVWESKDRLEKFRTHYPLIRELIETIYPPKTKNDDKSRQHIVLSSLAEKRLKAMGIENVNVLSDSFDYDKPTPLDTPDGEKYLASMKEDLWHDLGIGKNDVVIGGMTRITSRKRIELTIQLISEMQKIKNSQEMKQRIRDNGGSIAINNGIMTEDSEFVLLLCQNEDLADNSEYYEKLQQYAKSKNIKMVLAGDRIKQKPKFVTAAKKVYPFLDTYFIINGMDYPSEHEGFGNQFLEAVWGRHVLPILRYSVFEADIKNHTQHFIDQGQPSDLHPNPDFTYSNGNSLYELDSNINARAAKEWLDLLMQPTEYKRMAEENLKSIREKFSAKKVGEKYLEIINQIAEVMIGKRKAALIKHLDKLILVPS